MPATAIIKLPTGHHNHRGVIATILGAIGTIDWLVPFLNILCVVVPPITGANASRFHILKKCGQLQI